MEFREREAEGRADERRLSEPETAAVKRPASEAQVSRRRLRRRTVARQVSPPPLSRNSRKKPWWVYLVRCADGTLYCGATNDVARRIAAHNAGAGARYTRGRGPVRLLAQMKFSTKSEAMRAEARIKRLPRQEKIACLSGWR